jgi:hypothetical protein
MPSYCKYSTLEKFSTVLLQIKYVLYVLLIVRSSIL